MHLFGKILLWFGAISLVVGLIGAFLPWTYDIYVHLFPAEKTAYTNDSAGGPYPEMGFFLLAMAGFWIAICGVAVLLKTKKVGALNVQHGLPGGVKK